MSIKVRTISSVIVPALQGAALVAVSLAATPRADAQDKKADSVGLEEVVVTANRREENLQTVPLSITAFSGEELEAQGITDLKGITERTPGFSMGEFNPGQTQLYIRGIGSNEDGAGGDQSVVVFVDEVYIGRSAGQDVDLFDLERVEVLRGPQGTLFGRNVVGGAISVTTSKPTADTRLALEGSFGNFGAVSLRGLASGALSENVFGKMSFSSRRRDGYLENQIGNYAALLGPTGRPSFGFDDRVRKVNRDNIRGALRWVASDDVEVNVTASYGTLDEDGAVRHFIPGSASVAAGGRVLAAQNAALIPGYDNDYLKVMTDDVGRFTNDIVGLTARLDWSVSPDIRFTGIAAHREVDAISLEHGLGSPALSRVLASARLGPFTVDGFNDYSDNSITDTLELRLASQGETRLSWVAGLYFLQEDTFRIETNTTAIRNIANGALTGTGTNVNNVVASDAQTNKTTSYAAFGQVTFNFTDRLSGVLGGRWTSDDKEQRRVGTPNPLNPNTNFNLTSQADWSEFTGKAGVNFKISDDAFLFATASQGYKAGGFQGFAPNAAAAGTPFDPETALLYEIGAKTEWLDNRLRLNASVFQTDYKDLQILQLLVPVGSPAGTPGFLITQNAADAEVTGAELEFTFAPTERLTFQGGLTQLDTKFKSFFVPAGYVAPSGQSTTNSSRVGKALRNAPDLAYNILARYSQPLASGAAIRYQIDWRHKDEVFSDPDNLPQAAIPKYDLSDLRVSWTNRDGGLEIEGWVTNLFDEQYLIHNFPALGDGLGLAGPPRMYGVTVTWKN